MTAPEDHVEESLTYAQRQLRAAWRDPRLGRGRGAMAADFADALDEVDRTRSAYISAMGEMQDAVGREEARQTSANHVTGSDEASLCAATERAELAAADLANGHPWLNAMALIALVGALDALVEELVPAYTDMRIQVQVQSALQRVLEERPDLAAAATGEVLDALQAAAMAALEDQLGRVPRLTGSGSERWEQVLRHAGLGIQATHPIPEDLEEALCEVVSLRNIFVHRGGRLDPKADLASPTLRQKQGLQLDEFVRLDRQQYRRYSAAIRAYAEDVEIRLLAPLVSKEPVEWSSWRQHYYIGA